jgi:hypothetical protein
MSAREKVLYVTANIRAAEWGGLLSEISEPAKKQKESNQVKAGLSVTGGLQDEDSSGVLLANTHLRRIAVDLDGTAGMDGCMKGC